MTDRSFVHIVILIALAWAVGCRPQPPAPSGNGAASHGEHDHGAHDHAGHHHDHDHGGGGPHGGHMLDLTAEGHPLVHAEWVHDDARGIVTVYLLQPETNTPIAPAPPTIEIETRAGKSPRTYTLEAAGDDADPAAYTLADPTLVTALQIIVEGQEPILRAKIGEAVYEAHFEEHHHE